VDDAFDQGAYLVRKFAIRSFVILYFDTAVRWVADKFHRGGEFATSLGQKHSIVALLLHAHQPELGVMLRRYNIPAERANGQMTLWELALKPRAHLVHGVRSLGAHDERIRKVRTTSLGLMKRQAQHGLKAWLEQSPRLEIYGK
jgi:hypothetical protein